jgi:hypothetical protein
MLSSILDQIIPVNTLKINSCCLLLSAAALGVDAINAVGFRFSRIQNEAEVWDHSHNEIGKETVTSLVHLLLFLNQTITFLLFSLGLSSAMLRSGVSVQGDQRPSFLPKGGR